MVDKSIIIQKLDEMAVLMELKGENPFKIRAFSNASRILQGISDDISQLIENGQLTEIKGIGKGIANFINEIDQSGEPEELQNLKEEIPSGLLVLLRIPGMGAKKVKVVWEKLNIQTIGELEYACKENRLVDLDGFGEKTQQKILNGIDLLKRYSDRHLLSEVLDGARELHEIIKNFPGLIRSEIAGSLRRSKETVKDIDFVAAADVRNHDNILDAFTHLDQVERISSKGDKKSSVILKNGITAELRIVSDEEFPFSLHHTTGSKEHNVAMQEQAKKMNLKLNEYGLFEENGRKIGCKTETEIFETLGLSYISPELRENHGEIEAGLNKKIPKLIEIPDIKGVIHTHSTYSDGLHSIKELADAAHLLGYKYLVISDHSKYAIYANGLSEERIIQQFQEIDELNQSFEDFQILKSIECDILSDGSLDYTAEVLAGFDLVICSIHSRFQMTESEATKRLLKAMENPYTTIIGHPTGRLLLAREGYPVNMRTIITAASNLNIAIELNANPHRLDIDWRWLKFAREKGVKISINPDAHRVEGIQDIRYGVGIARKGWLTASDVLNCLSAEQVIQFAKARNS
ncbi:MAG: DNA polymerase/3'-5' exonuclease PolX [Calditrichae bacterium]|nr:DNA polymerase/3'-5' exonuclease PolX [Calditrichia bacterium]